MTGEQWIGFVNGLNLVSGRLPALIVAALLALVVLIILARLTRRAGLATTVTTVTVLVILGTTVEGAIVFAQDVLHAQGVGAALPAIVFEAIALKVGHKAYLYAKTHGHPGRYGTWLIMVGLVAGGIVSMGGHSVGECAFRFILPLLGVWLVWLDLTPDTSIGRITTVTWRWTPRRIAVRLGLVEPGEADLEQVHQEHRVRALTLTAHRVHHGGWLPRRVYRARLRRLALVSDDAMVAEARRRVLRVHRIEALTDPRVRDADIPDPVSDPERISVVALPVGPGSTADHRTPPTVARTPVHASESGQVTPDFGPMFDQPVQGVTGPDKTGDPEPDGVAAIVAAAHAKHPGATHVRLSQLTGYHVSTIKRHRPKTSERTGEPTGEPVNGRVPDLVDATV